MTNRIITKIIIRLLIFIMIILVVIFLVKLSLKENINEENIETISSELNLNDSEILDDNCSSSDKFSKPFLERAHKNSINISMSGNEKYAVSLDEYNELTIWDINTGKSLESITITGEEHTFDISYSGQYIVFNSDKTILIWDTYKNKIVRKLKGHSTYIKSLSITPDAKYLVSYDIDGALFFWDIGKGIKIRTVNNYMSTSSNNIAYYHPSGNLKITANGKYAVSGLGDDILFWFLQENRTPIVIKGLNEFLPKDEYHMFNGIDFIDMNDNAEYILGSGLYFWILWHRTSNSIVKSIINKNSSGKAILFNNSRNIIFHDLHNTLSMSILSDEKIVKTIKLKIDAFNNSFVSTNHGNNILVGNHIGKMSLWSLKTREKIKTFKGDITIYTQGIKFTDSNIWCEFDGEKQGFFSWNFMNGKINRLFSRKNKNLFILDSSPKLIYQIKNKFFLMDGNNNKIIQDFIVGEEDIQSFAIRENNNSLILLTGGKDGIIKYWDVNTGEKINELMMEKLSYFDILSGDEYSYITPDGRYAVFGRLGLNFSGSIIDLKTRRRIILHGSSISLITAIDTNFSKYIFTGEVDGGIKLWDSKDGRIIKSFGRNSNQISSLTIGENGNQAISGRSNGLIQLWDINSGSEIARFHEYKVSINGVNFFNDKFIVVSYENGFIKILTKGNLREIANRIQINEEDWVYSTPEGYFTGSKGATKHLNITKGLVNFKSQKGILKHGYTEQKQVLKRYAHFRA